MVKFRIYDIVKPTDEWLERENPNFYLNLYEAVRGLKITDKPKSYIGVVIEHLSNKANVEWFDKNVKIPNAWWEIDFEQIGRMQFDLERMKYPIVVPKKND